MMRGRVVKVFPDRGFGFVRPDDGGADIFIHINDASKGGVSSLDVGVELLFDVEPGRRSGRPIAVNISPIGQHDR